MAILAGKNKLSLGEYFANIFFSYKASDLGFSPLESASKTVSENVFHVFCVDGRCNDGRYQMDSPNVSFLLKFE